MLLSEGFVVGGRYRIDGLLAAGSKFRIYGATTDEDGPGRVAVKVARHDGVESLAGLQAGRAKVELEWKTLKRLHELGSSAAPVPIELVHMYPGDPSVRTVALLDKQLVRHEPYLVCELADGKPLAAVLQGELLDEERALLIALRIVLLIRAARAVSVELEDFSASNFVVDTAGENVSVVGLTGESRESLAALGTASGGGVSGAVPAGFGRLLAGLLAGMSPPEWGADEAALPRWERLLASRRVPREFHGLILGCLGFSGHFEARLDAVENRLRGLVRAPRPKVYDHPGRSRDAEYLIANGERIGDRFEVIKPLGQGGRGFVYRVRDDVSGAEVLIKCNKYIYDSGSAFALELPTRRLELEHEFDVLKKFAAKTGMLPQPVHLVRDTARGSWFDLAPDLALGEPFVVMEYVKGIPLLDLLPRPYEGYSGAADLTNRLRPRFVLRLIAQIAELLSRFHEDGYLYQDLKPENVLYDPKAENVYMVDFAGACPRLPSGELDKQHVAFGVQTHGFAAPEFGQLWERSDDRFDIYSLGATAYHLLTGVNPERVALEEGTEYPTLSRGPLQTLPPPVAMLVDHCLARVDRRLPTAQAVRSVAESARLQLSRSRPLDVRKPLVAYSDKGISLRWSLPDDPRLARIRVRRYEESEDDATVVYEGAPTDSIVDEDPAAGDRTYLIETAYERDGRSKHSRGRTVRSEAYPAPVFFSAEPYFGGNRVLVRAAPQASSVVVRWSTDSPPLGVDEGEGLEVVAGQVIDHVLSAGDTAHYAAFAAYGETVSAPRFASATALPPLPDPGTLEAEERTDQVVVRWENDVPGALVLRRMLLPGDRETRFGDVDPVELTPEPGEVEVIDAYAQPNARVRYSLVVRRDGVESDPVARTLVHRWPELPSLDLTPGVRGVRLDTTGTLDPRFSSLEIRAIKDAEEVSVQRVAPGDLPLTLGLEGNTEIGVVLRALVDDTESGPAAMGSVTVAPDDVQMTIVEPDGLLPIDLELRLPPSALRWTGVMSLQVSKDDEPLEVLDGSIAALFSRREGYVTLTIPDPSVEPGQDVLYSARLLAPDGATVALASAQVRGREQLARPQCTPKLAGVVIEAVDGVERVDVRLTRAGRSVELQGVMLPSVLELSAGERVEISVRRTVVGEPMPWSEASDIEALARPPAPQGLAVASGSGPPSLTWTPLDLSSVEYLVEDASDGTTLYRGRVASFVDITGRHPNRYAVYSLRHGLQSGAAHADVPAAAGPNAKALVPIRRSTRLRGLPRSTDSLVQCVRAEGVGIVELSGPARPRLIVVLTARDEAGLDAAVGHLRGPDWMQTSAVAGAVVVTGRRALVPFRDNRRPCRIVEAAMELERPEWRMVAPSVEPVLGGLVGAISSQANTVRLWSADRTVPLSDSDAVIVYGSDGVTRRAKIRTNASVAIRQIPPRGVDVSLFADAKLAAGLGLETAARPSVLVPAPIVIDDAALAALVWSDSARGFPLLVAQRLEGEWGAPIASMHLGNPSVFHFLKGADHVEITVGADVGSKRGRARIYIGAATAEGRHEKVFRAHLGRPASFGRLVARIARWIAKALVVYQSERDALDMIA